MTKDTKKYKVLFSGRPFPSSGRRKNNKRLDELGNH